VAAVDRRDVAVRERGRDLVGRGLGRDRELDAPCVRGRFLRRRPYELQRDRLPVAVADEAAARGRAEARPRVVDDARLALIDVDDVDLRALSGRRTCTSANV